MFLILYPPFENSTTRIAIMIGHGLQLQDDNSNEPIKTSFHHLFGETIKAVDGTLMPMGLLDGVLLSI